MKKIIFVIFLLSGWAIGQAQDLDMTKAYIVAGQYAKGKDGIDKFLSKAGNETNAEAWYYKAYLYNALSRDTSKTNAEMGALNTESFEALKKYKQLDAKGKLTKEESNGTIYNVYYAFYDFGLKAYNAKNAEGAYSQFKSALGVHDYIFSNSLDGPKGLKFSALDTDLVWNLAIIGNQLKRDNETVDYYKKIVEVNLNDPKYLQAYESIVFYYKEAKDQAAFKTYLEKGKANYPKESFWEAIDIEFAVQGLTGDALFKKYDELAALYPNSYVVLFNYGIELNKYVYADENKSLDLGAYKARIPELFKKALAINNTVESNIMLSSFYYNNYFDVNEAVGKIKGTKPEDNKKRAELANAAKKSMEDCQPYALASTDLFSKMPKLKTTEKNSYRQAYDMLVEVARVKGDTQKMAEYKAKKDAIQ